MCICILTLSIMDFLITVIITKLLAMCLKTCFSHGISKCGGKRGLWEWEGNVLIVSIISCNVFESLLFHEGFGDRRIQERKGELGGDTFYQVQLHPPPYLRLGLSLGHPPVTTHLLHSHDVALNHETIDFHFASVDCSFDEVLLTVGEDWLIQCVLTRSHSSQRKLAESFTLRISWSEWTRLPFFLGRLWAELICSQYSLTRLCNHPALSLIFRIGRRILQEGKRIHKGGLINQLAMAAVGGVRGLWSWYQARLAQEPVRTQVISSGVLWAAGDIIAQTVEAKIQKRSQGKQSGPKARDSALVQDGLKGEMAAAGHSTTLDFERVARTSFFGFGFVGPVGHFWYEGLEHLVKNKLKLAPNSVSFICTKLFVDTGLFGPIHLLAFFTYMGLASGKPFEQVKKDIQRDFPPTFMTEGATWFFVQIANFRFVPVKNQLLFVNLVCIADSAFLSWVKHQDDAPWKRFLTSLVTPESKPKDH